MMQTMQRTTAILIVSVAVLFGCQAQPTREITADTWSVLRVIDGDTFVIHYDGEPTSVRLYDFDAPELAEPGGPAAADRLRKFIDGRDVRLVFPAARKRDNFGRLLARVYADNVDISAALTDRPLADQGSAD